MRVSTPSVTTLSCNPHACECTLTHCDSGWEIEELKALAGLMEQNCNISSGRDRIQRFWAPKATTAAAQPHQALCESERVSSESKLKCLSRQSCASLLLRGARDPDRAVDPLLEAEAARQPRWCRHFLQILFPCCFLYGLAQDAAPLR